MCRSICVTLILVFAVTLGGGSALRADDPPKRATAAAEIVVIKMGAAANKDMPAPEDYVATQLAILRSGKVIERAIEQGKLNELACLKGRNGRVAILNALTVEREKEPGSQAIKLSVNGLPPNDAVAILNALIPAYQEVVKEIYKSGYGEIMIRQLNEMRTDLEAKARKADEEYEKFINEDASAWLAIKAINGPSADQKDLNFLAEDMSKRRREIGLLRSFIESLVDAKKNQADERALTTYAAVFAKERGITLERPTVDEIISALKIQQAAETRLLAVLDSVYKDTMARLMNINHSMIKEERLRENRDRAKELFRKLGNVAEAVDLRFDLAGCRIHVITQPHAVD